MDKRAIRAKCNYRMSSKKAGQRKPGRDLGSYDNRPSAEEKREADMLLQMGLIDLRMTRPAQPPHPESHPTRAYETEYEQLRDARELRDVPPAVPKRRKADAGALKREKEKMLFGEGGQDAAVQSGGKSGVMFANMDGAALERFRNMLVNFCRKEDGTFYDDIDLRQYGIDSGQIISNAVVQELCTVQPSLTRLDLTNCEHISDVGLWAIARHCGSLKHLILRGCHQITNVGLRSLSLALSNVITLDFNHCHLLDDISLTVIATGAWKLEELYLQNCTGLTDTGVGKVAHTCHNLVTLDLQGCSNVGEFGDHALKEIGAFCGKLKNLDLSGCKRVEDPGLRAVAVGCPNLETLKLAGCDLVTTKSIAAMCKHLKAMQTLHLVGCRKLTDKDFDLFNNCAMAPTLTDLDLSGNPKITDRGVAAVCKAFGDRVFSLGFAQSSITDFSSQIISNLCRRVRDLNLVGCSHLSNETVHTLARKVSSLCTLKLDGCPRVTVEALISHVGGDNALEFCVMAEKWLGYQPKGNVNKLIAAREKFRQDTRAALKIQCALRRKFAYSRWRVKRAWYLMTKVLPRWQAHLRGAFQRKRYKEVLYYLDRVKQATQIQKRWRLFKAYWWKKAKIKELLFAQYRLDMSIRIQRRYRGMMGRRIVVAERNRQATERLVRARIVAKQEIKAIVIQRTVMAFLGRVAARKRLIAREGNRQLLALHDRMTRYIQRVARGRLGRKRAKWRRDEIRFAHLRWVSARKIQKSYRGLIGKRRWWAEFDLKEMRFRNRMALRIQTIFRGYRGKILANIARGLRILRIRKNRSAVTIQRVVRGNVARAGVKHYRENVLRDQLRKKAVVVVQRIFRGHKGREAAEIEREVRSFEGKAKPLIDLIKKLEQDTVDQARFIQQIDDMVKRSEDELFKIERELAMCMQTTSKYTDSARVNNTPQRFLTKYLRVRLKDHYDHEKELHQARLKEAAKRKGECRSNDVEIAAARRELIPLTTGVVIQVKKRRAEALRIRVRARKAAAVKVQSIWRRACVRTVSVDPVKMYWVKCFDLEQSEKPYYYNSWTNATEWKEPAAHKYFCRRYEKKKLEDDDDDEENFNDDEGV